MAAGCRPQPAPACPGPGEGARRLEQLEHAAVVGGALAGQVPRHQARAGCSRPPPRCRPGRAPPGPRSAPSTARCRGSGSARPSAGRSSGRPGAPGGPRPGRPPATAWPACARCRSGAGRGRPSRARRAGSGGRRRSAGPGRRLGHRSTLGAASCAPASADGTFWATMVGSSASSHRGRVAQAQAGVATPALGHHRVAGAGSPKGRRAARAGRGRGRGRPRRPGPRPGPGWTVPGAGLGHEAHRGRSLGGAGGPPHPVGREAQPGALAQPSQGGAHVDRVGTRLTRSVRRRGSSSTVTERKHVARWTACTASIPLVTWPNRLYCLPRPLAQVAQADEELRAVGVGPGVGHGHRARQVLALHRLVRELVARPAAARCPRGSRPGSRSPARPGGR